MGPTFSTDIRIRDLFAKAGAAQGAAEVKRRWRSSAPLLRSTVGPLGGLRHPKRPLTLTPARISVKNDDQTMLLTGYVNSREQDDLVVQIVLSWLDGDRSWPRSKSWTRDESEGLKFRVR